MNKLNVKINMGNSRYYSLEIMLSPYLRYKKMKVTTYITIILPVKLGVSPWERSRGLGCSRIKFLEKFGAKRDKITGEWRNLYRPNIELYALYSSPNIIRNLKSRRLRWAGHVVRMGKSGSAYKVLVGTPEGKRPLLRPRRRWEDNIKMDLKEVGSDARKWMDFAQDRDQ